MSDNNITDIVNRALGYLGEQKITNADAPETVAGKRIVDNYNDCRREFLERTPWCFAETWAQLIYLEPAPAGFDYSDLYLLPTDYIRVNDIPVAVTPSNFASVRSVEEYRFVTFNQNNARCIALSNNANPTLNMAYTADITNLNLWSPLAKKCLSTWMAMDVCKGVTGMDTLWAQLDKSLTYELQDAVGVNGNVQRKRRQRFSEVQRERDFAFGGAVSFFTPVIGYPTS